MPLLSPRHCTAAAHEAAEARARRPLVCIVKGRPLLLPLIGFGLAVVGVAGVQGGLCRAMGQAR